MTAEVRKMIQDTVDQIPTKRLPTVAANIELAADEVIEGLVGCRTSVAGRAAYAFAVQVITLRVSR